MKLNIDSADINDLLPFGECSPLFFFHLHLRNTPISAPDSEPNSIRSPLVESVIYDAIENLSSNIDFIKEAISTHNPVSNNLTANEIVCGSVINTSPNSGGNLVGMGIVSTGAISSADEPETGIVNSAMNSEQIIGGNLTGMGVTISSVTSAGGPESDPTVGDDHFDTTAFAEQMTNSQSSSVNATDFFPNGLLLDELNNSIDSVLDQDLSYDHIDGGKTTNVTPIVDIDSSDVYSSAANRELHLTKLPTDITEDDIHKYLQSKGVPSTDVKLTKLFKNDTDLSLLSFISYKIDTKESTAQLLTSKDFWPAYCVIKNFNHKNPKRKRNIASVADFRLHRSASNQT